MGKVESDLAFSAVPIGRIPLFDARDNALGLFDTASAERIAYQLNPELVRTALGNGVTPTIEHGLRFIHWELYRRGPNDYVYAGWSQDGLGSKDYVGRVLTASDVARLWRDKGFRAPAIVWTDLEKLGDHKRTELVTNREPPATGASEQGEGKASKTKPSNLKAYYAYLYASTKLETNATTREAWDYLREYGIDDELMGEMAGYNVPDKYSTFEQQVSRGRKAVANPKNTSRADRPIGKSIVRGEKIEFGHDNDG
jgi:hypothetical protein